MTGQHDEFRRALGTMLREEADSTPVDTAAAVPRLERVLSSSVHTQRLIAISATVAAVVIAVIGVALGGGANDQSTPPASDKHSPLPPVTSSLRPYLLDITTGERQPLARSLVPESLGQDTGHDDFHFEVSPDGERLAYVCHGHDAGCLRRDAIVVADIDGMDTRTLPLPPEPSTTDRLDWSPDGTTLAYTVHMHGGPTSGGLYVQDIATGHKRQLVDFYDEFSVSIASTPAHFSADGQNVLFHVPRGGWQSTCDVWQVPVRGGEPTMVLSEAAFPMPLPAGAGLAFLECPANSSPNIQVVDDQGERRTLVEASVSIARPALSPDGRTIAYQDGRFIRLVDVETGDAGRLIRGRYSVAWVDENTLLLAPYLCC